MFVLHCQPENNPLCVEYDQAGLLGALNARYERGRARSNLKLAPRIEIKMYQKQKLLTIVSIDV